MSRPKITVLLPVFNVETYIRRTLDCLGWADELLVVDSFSKDRTVEICKEYGARVIQHEYVNSAKQKNWALEFASHDWVFQIDSDEILEEGAAEEIAGAVSEAGPEVRAYRMPRKNLMLGKWVRHGGVYPDFQTRLFRRSKGHWVEREVHAHVSVDGSVGTLTHHIIHFGAPNLSKQLSNLDRYTRYEADELRKQGKRFHAGQVVVRPWLLFLYRYVWRLGFLDGWRGFFVCSIITISDFLSHAKLWEIEELGIEKSPRGGYGS